MLADRADDAPHIPGSTAAIRKVQRLARLAGRFEMPLVLLVDCPGRTRRYDQYPTVISGPGAGAAVTAAGMLGDALALARTM